jgi:membrane protease YdiL (CAAX protease family)
VDRKQNNADLACFLGLTLVCSCVFYVLIISAGHVGAGGGNYVGGLMWCPALGAFLTVRIRRLDIRSLGLAWGGDGRYAAIGYLTPLAYATLAYALVWVCGGGFFPDPAAITAIGTKLGWHIDNTALFVLLYLLLLGTITIIASLGHALGEEIGWRGFLAPHLVGRLGFTGSAVLTGLIWTAWHLPLLLFADYNSGTLWWFALSCFTVMVVGLSVILTWLRLKSNSIWPCAIFHASHNLFIQGFFSPLTGAKGGITSYLIGEFGVAVPAVVALFAIGFWRARPAAPETSPAV